MKQSIFVIGTYKSGSSLVFNELSKVRNIKVIPGSHIEKSDSGYLNFGEFNYYSMYGGIFDAFLSIEGKSTIHLNNYKIRNFIYYIKFLLLNKNLQLLKISLQNYCTLNATHKFVCKILSNNENNLDLNQRRTYFKNELSKFYNSFTGKSDIFIYDQGFRLSHGYNKQLYELFDNFKVIIVLRDPLTQIRELIFQNRHLYKYNNLIAGIYGSQIESTVFFLLNFIYSQTKISLDLSRKNNSNFRIFFFEDFLNDKTKEFTRVIDFLGTSLILNDKKNILGDFSNLRDHISYLDCVEKRFLDSRNMDLISKIKSLQSIIRSEIISSEKPRIIRD